MEEILGTEIDRTALRRFKIGDINQTFLVIKSLTAMTCLINPQTKFLLKFKKKFVTKLMFIFVDLSQSHIYGQKGSTTISYV